MYSRYMTRTESQLVDEQLHNMTITLMNLNDLAAANSDRSLIPGWVEHLKALEAGVRAARYQLESLQSDRKCWTCGGPVVGRSDRVYCSTACRVENHRGTSSRMVEEQEARKLDLGEL